MSEIVQNLLVRPMACIKEIIHSGQMLWKRYYDSRSCIENLVNDNKIDTTDQYMFHLTAIRQGCARRRRSAGVCTRPVVVCRVLQSGG